MGGYLVLHVGDDDLVRCRTPIELGFIVHAPRREAVLVEEDSAVQPNNGISLSGTVALNLVDPGTGANADRRITLAEFQPQNLPNIFRPDIDAVVDIDGLKVSAILGGGVDATLGTLKISLDGATDGQVHSLGDLQALPSKIKVEGDIGGISALIKQAILRGLEELVSWADRLDDTEPFTRILPLVGKSLGEVLNLPERLRTSLLNPVKNYFDTTPVPTIPDIIQKLQGFGGRVESASAKKLVFHPTINQTVVKSLPIDLGTDVASLGIGLDAAATVDLSVTLEMPNFGFGVDFGAGLDPARLFFFELDRLILRGAIATPGGVSTS